MKINRNLLFKVSLIMLLLTCFLSRVNSQSISDSLQINDLIAKGFEVQKSNLDTAILIAQKAIDWSQKIKYQKGLATGLKLMATTLYFKGGHEKAMELYLSSLKQFELLKDSIGVAGIYNELGTLWKKQGDLKKAKAYFNDALKIFHSLNNAPEEANTLNNIGIVYEMQGEYNEALNSYLTSLAIHKQSNNKVAMGYCLANLGGVYTNLKMFKEAEDALLQSLEIRLQLKELQNIAICYTNLGEFYSAQNNVKAALPFYLKSLDMAQQTGFIDLIQYDYEKLSDCYSKRNDFKKAYEYHTMYAAFKDSIFDENKNKQIAELQTKYDTEKKEQQNLLLKKENQLKGISLRKAQLQNYFLLVIIILVLAVVYLFYNQLKARQKQVLSDAMLKQEQLRLRSVILMQEQERKRISQDLHDGIGQMLSAVKLNLAAIDNKVQKESNDEIQLEKAIVLIDESCSEIRNISHNMMPAILIKSGLIAALNEMAKRVSTSSGIKIYVDHDEHIGRIESEYEINLFRIVQELLNNIIKHADATEVHIHLNKEAENLNIMIEDNGKVFDKSLIEGSKGNGWYNINSRLTIMNGKIDIESNKDSGTVVFIDVPLLICVNKS